MGQIWFWMFRNAGVEESEVLSAIGQTASDDTNRKLFVNVRATIDHQIAKTTRPKRECVRAVGANYAGARSCNFFLRLTANRGLSEDLVQIVFYRILKYRHTYRDEGKFSAWIYHLARKVAASTFQIRSRKYTAASSVPLPCRHPLETKVSLLTSPTIRHPHQSWPPSSTTPSTPIGTSRKRRASKSRQPFRPIQFT